MSMHVHVHVQVTCVFIAMHYVYACGGVSDVKARFEILKVHAKKVKMDEGKSVSPISSLFVIFSHIFMWSCFKATF